MTLALLRHPRTRLQKLHHAMRGDLWFPQLPLALLVSGGGLWLLDARFGAHWRQYIDSLMRGEFHLSPALLPPLLIGGGMLTMGVALLWRSRLA